MLLVRNLSQIATPTGTGPVRGAAMRAITVHDHGVIVIDGDRFAYAGGEREMPQRIREKIDGDFDARGATAIPGFVDSHTHIPFAGFRESEFNRRLQGETYAEIAATGGGINATVRATRQASQQELVENVLARTRTMA